MSMLADMLSKVHQPAVKREVAPNLQNIVKAPSGLSAHKKKIFVLSAVLIVCVLSGTFFVQYLKSITDQSDVIILSSLADNEKQDNRERQLPGSENPGLLQRAEASDSLRGEPQGTPIMVSDEVSRGVVTEEKSPVPDVVSTEEDKKEGPRSSQDSLSGVVSESGPLKHFKMNDTSENSDKQDKEKETANLSVPALHTDVRDTHGIDAYLYRAREDELKGDYSSALMNYKKVLELDRENFAVMNNVAYIFLRLNLTEESIRYSHMAMDINRNYAPALINLGIAYARSGDIASAEENLSAAYRLEPDNQDVLMNIAVLLERQGRLPEASEYFSRLVKLGSINGSMGLARVHEKQGRVDEAIKLYRSVYENTSADEKIKSGARQRIMVLKNIKQ